MDRDGSKFDCTCDNLKPGKKGLQVKKGFFRKSIVQHDWGRLSDLYLEGDGALERSGRELRKLRCIRPFSPGQTLRSLENTKRGVEISVMAKKWLFPIFGPGFFILVIVMPICWRGIFREKSYS